MLGHVNTGLWDELVGTGRSRGDIRADGALGAPQEDPWVNGKLSPCSLLPAVDTCPLLAWAAGHCGALCDLPL